MRREQRLCASDDFQRVRDGGRSLAHPLLVLFWRRSGGGAPTRVGVTVGRRVGNAVTRNRVRRRVREAVRLRYSGIVPGWDLVFVARAGSERASYAALSGAVDALLRRSGVARPESPCDVPFSGSSASTR